MRRHQQTTLAMALLVMVAATGCSSTQTAGEQLDDAAITASVKTKLAADPEVNPFDIDVDTTDGVVRLSGTVDQAGDKREAEELARRTDGVKRVVNDIKVGREPTGGQEADCARIATEVNSKLAADPAVSALAIDVDCEKGNVTLSGEVESAGQSATAERLARGTSGVTGVTNRLTVGGGR